jgi:hypothetical protein
MSGNEKLEVLAAVPPFPCVSFAGFAPLRDKKADSRKGAKIAKRTQEASGSKHRKITTTPRESKPNRVAHIKLLTAHATNVMLLAVVFDL